MPFLKSFLRKQQRLLLMQAQKRPTVVTDENGNDKIEIRLILPITIAIDHRALDYGDVVPFMRKFLMKYLTIRQ